MYQSTHVNDWIGTWIGGNTATGGIDIGALKVGNAHGTYGLNKDGDVVSKAWGSTGNDPARVCATGIKCD